MLLIFARLLVSYAHHYSDTFYALAMVELLAATGLWSGRPSLESTWECILLVYAFAKVTSASETQYWIDYTQRRGKACCQQRICDRRTERETLHQAGGTTNELRCTPNAARSPATVLQQWASGSPLMKWPRDDSIEEFCLLLPEGKGMTWAQRARTPL